MPRNKIPLELPYSIACEMAIGFLAQAIEERLEFEKPGSKLTAESLVDTFAVLLKQYLERERTAHGMDSVTKH